MSISDYILNDVDIRPITEKVGHLKEMFDELTYSHLPIKRGESYCGCISENDLRCFDNAKNLEDYRYALVPFYTRKDAALMDILNEFAHYDTNLLPVLDEKGNTYLGYLELSDIINDFNKTPFLGEEGEFVIVEKEPKDFTFSEISQIIESNKGNIFGLYISDISNRIVQITIKLDLPELDEIIQSLRQNGYKIVSEHQEDSYRQELKERSAYLKKFLNI